MEVCPPGFLCIDNNTLVLALIIIFLIIAYITSMKKMEYTKLVDYRDLSKNNEDLLKKYMKTIEMKKEIILNHNKNDKNNKNMDDKNTNILIKKNNIYVVPPSSHNSMLINKEHERLINPLLPPERSYNSTYSVPVNIPTRGFTSNYQQVGVLSAETHQGLKMLPLFGRPQWKGANRWNFYTSTDQYNSLKLPVYSKKRDCQDQIGCDELYDGDSVNIPQYGDHTQFKVSMYKLDSPTYIPN